MATTTLPTKAYQLGDLVDLTTIFHGQERTGPYEIVRLMPETQNGVRQYRVRGPDSRERAVDHHEIVEGTARRKA